MSDTVAIPTKVRVAAYLLGLIVVGLGAAVIALLVALHKLSTPGQVFALALVAFLTGLTHTLALAHISLPSGSAVVTVVAPTGDEPTQQPDAPVTTTAPATTGAPEPSPAVETTEAETTPAAS